MVALVFLFGFFGFVFLVLCCFLFFGVVLVCCSGSQ